ncbi:MAG: GNAT family N-acetyltransferase [Boseongicola sp.]
MPVDLTIRPVTSADNLAIWAMLEPVFRTGDTYAIAPNISQDDALNYWLGEHAYVAEDNEIRGTFYIRDNQKGGGVHVCNCGFVTARGAEGKGVAGAMLSHSLAEAKRLGYQAMQFNFVLDSNIRAVELWKRYGFNQIGRLPRAFQMPDGDQVDALILHKFL